MLFHIKLKSLILTMYMLVFIEKNSVIVIEFFEK